MTVILKNNASGFLATSISATDTSIILSTGTGANFPSLTSGQYFYATFSPTSGASEIVKCTARSGDTLTVIRAQEGTSALSFAGGSRVELRVTAQSVIDAIADQVAEHDQASEISFVPTGNVAATNVQDAIAELADPTAVSAAGTGSQTVFPVSVKPTAIHINGVYQNKSTWAFAGGNVTFSQAPPFTSVIEFLI